MGIVNHYRIAPDLRGGSFISITLAWDRAVQFDTDGGTTGVFDAGDKFIDYKATDGPADPPADSVINNLRLSFLPKGGTVSDILAVSDSNEGTLQHIFFQVPTTGQYEIWVEPLDEDVGTTQNYSIAWWAATSALVAMGDFNNDGIVDASDLSVWQTAFGNSAMGDANGDGVSDGADFLIWQSNLGATASTVNSSSVPEPSAWMLSAFALLVIRRRAA